MVKNLIHALKLACAHYMKESPKLYDLHVYVYKWPLCTLSFPSHFVLSRSLPSFLHFVFSLCVHLNSSRYCSSKLLCFILFYMYMNNQAIRFPIGLFYWYLINQGSLYSLFSFSNLSIALIFLCWPCVQIVSQHKYLLTFSDFFLFKVKPRARRDNGRTFCGILWY